MVELKQERSSNQDISINYSSDAETYSSFLGEDWVIVKKLKVNILIPPLPSTSSNPVASNPTSEQLKDAVLREMDNTASEFPTEKGSEQQSALVKDKPLSAAMESIPLSARDDLLKLYKSTRTPHGLRTVKQWRLSPMESKLSKTMKASNLERKLLRAGGLSSWLTSIGLEQFIRIFHARKVSKFQLVNLSMTKLKYMGINAVGPRRKLMHAIECVCNPCCFESF